LRALTAREERGKDEDEAAPADKMPSKIQKKKVLMMLGLLENKS
jgi:hypothetical protein